MKSRFILLPAITIALATVANAQTYSNGPLITHPGGGFGGANASALENVAPLGLNVFGYGGQDALGNRLADDFTVPCGQSWTITQIRVFGYQTQAVPSTITTLSAANYRIWGGGAPGLGGTVLHDFSGANQMTSSDFALNTYRVLIGGLLANNRPIFTAYMSGNAIVLGPGTYWLDFALAGTLASGPFVPPVTILGQGTTGDGYQAIANTWSTAPLINGGLFATGVPFEIDYSATPLPCLDFTISQPGPGLPITLTDSNGTPGNSAFNAIALAAGAFPNGWFYGIDMDPMGLAAQFNAGPPFNVVLNGSGGFSLGPIGAPPIPIGLWYVAVELDALGQIVGNSTAKTITLMP